MNKTLIRLVALLLVPCLVGDPVTASAFSANSLSPMREWESLPASASVAGVRGAVQINLFSQQALAAVVT